jgi:hypothetical protein
MNEKIHCFTSSDVHLLKEIIFMNLMKKHSHVGLHTSALKKAVGVQTH